MGKPFFVMERRRGWVIRAAWPPDFGDDIEVNRAIEYFEDGLLTQGVALIAWPADYGVSGVMSFMVNHTGAVYEKDMGEDTGALVGLVEVYDPDSSWSLVVSEDEP